MDFFFFLAQVRLRRGLITYMLGAGGSLCHPCDAVVSYMRLATRRHIDERMGYVADVPKDADTL